MHLPQDTTFNDNPLEMHHIVLDNNGLARHKIMQFSECVADIRLTVTDSMSLQTGL